MAWKFDVVDQFILKGIPTQPNRVDVQIGENTWKNLTIRFENAISVKRPAFQKSEELVPKSMIALGS